MNDDPRRVRLEPGPEEQVLHPGDQLQVPARGLGVPLHRGLKQDLRLPVQQEVESGDAGDVYGYVERSSTVDNKCRSKAHKRFGAVFNNRN